MHTPSPAFTERAVALAEQWQHRANQLRTRTERRRQAQMVRLLAHPGATVLLSRLIDQSFRSRSARRVADQIRHLLGTQGTMPFLTLPERALLGLFRALPTPLAALAVPLLIDRLRAASKGMIIAGEPQPLRDHLRTRRAQGVRLNLNQLGEAVLGEAEAAARLATSIKDLEDPEVEVISVKISTLYSQISPLAFEETVAVLRERLRAVYRAAIGNPFVHPHGSRTAKCVNLDMEAYRDLELTVRAFMDTLGEEEFFGLTAGIALQAYLPDSFALQRQLTGWARERVARGGAPVRLRIVKGANLEMERLEAALANWPPAPFAGKLEVDANYQRMVAFGMEPDNIGAVRLGIASHNLFDLAHARTLAEINGVADLFCFEMLEGMADPIRRAVQESGSDVLLYAPAARRDDFLNAVAYLIRRLDENTGPDNFLRFAPHLTVGSSEWQRLKTGFLNACAHRDAVRRTPHRIQDRATETFAPEISTLHRDRFVNEADTDWALAANRRWAEAIRDRWQQRTDVDPLRVEPVVDGRSLFTGRAVAEHHDPSRQGVVVGRSALATAEDGRRALAVAAADPDGWRHRSGTERHAILARVAMELRRARGDLIGIAAAETGKLFTEADAEVSEAVDFAEFYPLAVSRFDRLSHVRLRGLGVILVIAPWNFPLAIPCGGIAAALAAGNTVIFKPASEAVCTASALCQCFWRAGVSKRTLQFLPGPSAEIGPVLTDAPQVDAIILTGSTDTGLAILARTPFVHLAAETGGKNATIVTDLADRDQAIQHVLHSAFSHSGQKCSATSLLILERTVYDDPRFRRQLVDAAASLRVGPAWDFATRVGPLIRPPAGALLRGLTTLEPGEQWALQPAMVDANPRLWSPGIKYDVRPGSFTHLTELFGPVLGVMRAENLAEAIDLVNRTGYGLTSGLESLDRREQELWRDRIRAGNLYINRPTTGAMVLRQPFGGMGKSALGPGLKAGGPEYVTQFMRIDEQGPPPAEPLAGDHRLLRLSEEWQRMLRWGWQPEHREEIERTVAAVASCLHQMETRYGRVQDFFHLRGQDNLIRFLPVADPVIRLHAEDNLSDTLIRCAAALIAGCTPWLSLPPELANPVTGFLANHQGQRFLGTIRTLVETDAQLAARITSVGRLRYAAPQRVPAAIFAAAAPCGVWIARAPVCAEGRFELLHYLHQQAICDNYHRYGNLGDRAVE